MNEIKYFSMFTGVGGFELGLQGFTCIGFSEIDKFSSELLKNKWPEIKNYGDATKINPEELPDFQLLVGGFPCQAFSIAGKRKGFEDTRGTLFHDIVRILKVKRPKRILLENVKGLLNHDGGRTFATILASLSELGYVIQWMVLNSKFFGVPQNRERVFIIGSLRGGPIPEILPLGEISEKDIKQSEKPSPTITSRYYKQGNSDPYISQLNNPTHSNNRIYGEKGISPALNTAQGGNRQPKIVASPMRWSRTEKGREFRRGAMKKGKDLTPFGEGYRELVESKEEVIGCVTSALQKDALLKQDMKIRRLTPTECERLQGFPDGWTEGFSDTQRYKMMGNAVTVNVIRAIAQRLNETAGGAG